MILTSTNYLVNWHSSELNDLNVRNTFLRTYRPALSYQSINNYLSPNVCALTCDSSSWRERMRDLVCMLRTSSLLFRKQKSCFFISFPLVKQCRQFDIRLAATISSAITADGLLQKPENVKARLDTYTDQFARDIILGAYQ